MSDEKGNQVQILNRPAAVSPSKIFEYSQATVRPADGKAFKEG
jgi:hypothetical protein